jgi:hypothetical protein
MLTEIEDQLDSLMNQANDMIGVIDFKTLSKSTFPKMLRVRLMRVMNNLETAIYAVDDVKDYIADLIDKEEGRM